MVCPIALGEQRKVREKSFIYGQKTTLQTTLSCFRLVDLIKKQLYVPCEVVFG